jgi:acetylornithine/N-succinyldiaminopimelate aminotransferase
MENLLTKTMQTKNVMATYARKEVCFIEGKGMWLMDDRGNRYMDMVSGVAVNALGHSSEVVLEALQKQAKKVMHISNLYWNEPQMALAEILIELSGDVLKDVFFCNSGTEALEGALKLCKKYGQENGKKYLLYMDNSFHGRTIGALSITGQEKYQMPFGALIPDCISVPFNDLQALTQVLEAYKGQIAAIFIEPIQGEGGVIEVREDFIHAVEQYCHSESALLVFDEVQCGAARMGTYYAFQSIGVIPDIVCMAKGLGGGVPIGAILSNEKASVFSKGDHGSTYGGNPLVCAVSLAVTQTISTFAFLEAIKVKEIKFKMGFKAMEALGLIKAYRGKGLLLALSVEDSNKVVEMAFQEKLLLISAGAETVRILPPLNVTGEEIELVLAKIQDVLEKCI